MTLLFFFSLCVSIAGADDCSYDWQVISDRAEFESTYLKFNGKEDPTLVTGFTVSSVKKIFVTPEKTIETIIHERKHVICNLTWKDNPLRAWHCNFKTDQVYSVQSVRPESECPIIVCLEVPEETERMAFQKLLYSNQIIGKIP